jgi:outer membrane lipoprotein LolB
VAAALAAAACAEVAFVRPAQDLQFELAGRIAVRYRNEAASANLAWRHSAGSDELLITSALGQGVARIVREGAEVMLSTPERGEFRAADAESLTEKVLGFRLPLAGLADWVRARPAPGPAKQQFDASGRLAELEQSGWRVYYLEYAEARPARLRLVYPGLELRLAISEWK